MAEPSNDIVLWASPRFHRPILQFTQNWPVNNSLNATLTSPAQAPDQEKDVLKMIGEAIREDPEAAACLYACR